MSPLWLRKTEGDRAAKGKRKNRRRGRDRRTGKDRRKRGSRRTEELYQSDLDRHLWSWASPASAKKRRKEKARRERRRTVAGVVASAAGALSAAGLSYFLYKRLREDERPPDPDQAQGDLDEADFE